ncbi:hypothetical protein QYE76_052262 [Lolium multiflorum]|uniref:Uncharacterized protein n=1 Tax=Lolium multiflorum TaxID=4521 RepID=A0AAD8WKW5_LOLMU|nr:hypothetical protein QYE76_052262 [Lolium multiflorum]
MGTLSDDLYRLVSGPDGRACSTWTRITRFFLDNKASHYLFLSKAFRSTPRGDLPISTYASKLQRIAHDLAATGRPAEILKTTVPSFTDDCSRLQHTKVDATSENQHVGAQEIAVQTGDRGALSGSSAPVRPPGVIPNYHGRNLIPGFQYGQQGGRGGSEH